MLIIWSIITPLAAAFAFYIAYRGKGGGFTEWGVVVPASDFRTRALSSIMAALGCMALTGKSQWFFADAVLWYLFILPSPAWVFHLQDSNTLAKKLRDTPQAVLRQLLILPLFFAVYYAAHGWHYSPSAWWASGALILGPLYGIAGDIGRAWPNLVPWSRVTALAESAHLVIGLFLWGLIQN